MRYSIKPTFHALLCAFLFISAVHADPLLEKAKNLINQDKASEAYALLYAEYENHAGSAEFDLLLGIAALNAGEPTQAVFALERVLAIEPQNAQARAELARAYFVIGENEAAKAEFNEIRDKNLPDSLSRTIDKYLSAIDARIGAQRTRIDVYIDGTLGFDSNVNSATDTSTVAIPALGNLQFALDNSGRELDSGFFSLGAGTFVSTPFMDRDDLRLYGGLNLNERITFSETDFKTRTLNAQVGLRYQQGRTLFSVPSMVRNTISVVMKTVISAVLTCNGNICIANARSSPFSVTLIFRDSPIRKSET